jgi:hypothetical protein
MCASPVILMQLPKANNYPLCKKSPNVVTLPGVNVFHRVNASMRN